MMTNILTRPIMTRSRAHYLVCWCAVAALVLAGCTLGQRDLVIAPVTHTAPPAKPVTVTITAHTDETTVDENSHPSTWEPFDQSELPDLTSVGIGDTITLPGKHLVQVCLIGQGFGLNFLAAGEGTDCELARAVFAEVIAGHDHSETVRLTGEKIVEATIPGTTTSHVLGCVQSRKTGVVTCAEKTGGRATVFMWPA